MVLLLCAKKMQVMCECVLYVRQNPPLLEIYKQVVGFINNLCYVKGLNFTLYFFIHNVLLK